VDPENNEMLKPPPTASPQCAEKPEEVQGAASATEFYRVRYRFYSSLLMFVVVVGLPIISVPALRHRLSGRVQALREAMAGGTIKPAVANVGENKEPFPAEYEKKVGAPNYPKLPAYLAAAQGFSGPVVSSSPAPSTSAAPTRSIRSIRIPKTSEDTEAQAGAAAKAQEPAAGQDAAGAEAQPKYQQGQMEKESYDFLLKSNPTISGMVLGSNPSLRFKSWDALKREEDAFWVRLTFVSVPGNTDVDYIWQVKLLSKQITPLSYNARTLASP
jgi:hypothetical protein